MKKVLGRRTRPNVSALRTDQIFVIAVKFRARSMVAEQTVRTMSRAVLSSVRIAIDVVDSLSYRRFASRLGGDDLHLDQELRAHKLGDDKKHGRGSDIAEKA